MNAPQHDPEADLRQIWTARGVSVDQQDEMIAAIAEKARPGAQIGPWSLTTSSGLHRPIFIGKHRAALVGERSVDGLVWRQYEMLDGPDRGQQFISHRAPHDFPNRPDEPPAQPDLFA